MNGPLVDPPHTPKKKNVNKMQWAKQFKTHKVKEKKN